MTLKQAWLERVLLPLNARHVCGPRSIVYDRDELIVVCLAKDAEYHVEPFIAHYLRLGVRHIVLLDNGSTDQTVARAAPHPEVTIFNTTVPFRGHNRSMRRFLVRRFGGRDRWVLCVDVDELFDYPYSDRLDIAGLLRYLRSRRCSAMVAYLLDMVSDRPLSDESAAREPMQRAFPYYDISAVRKYGYFEEDGYRGDRWVRHNTVANPEIARYVGGIRAQAFDLPEVYLIKHPLMLVDGRAQLVHQHFVDHASVADISGVLYHYKFVPGFIAKVDRAVQTRAYASDSWEYCRYQRALAAQPDLCLKTPGARRLRGVNDLIADGFLHVTGEYRDWVAREGRHRLQATS